MANFDWTDLLHTIQMWDLLRYSTDLFHILDMTNFDWTDLLHITQIWDLFRYRPNPYTGYDEFWLDRPVTYHPDLRFIEVQSYSTHWIWRILTGDCTYHPDLIYWIWRILTGQTYYIPSRCEIYLSTELIPYTGYDEFWLDRPITYHPDVRWDIPHTGLRILTGDLLHTTQIWDLLRYRAIPHTGYDEFWLDRPITYHPDVRFI